MSYHWITQITIFALAANTAGIIWVLLRALNG